MVSGIPTVVVYYISLQKDEKKDSKAQMARELLLTTIAPPPLRERQWRS